MFLVSVKDRVINLDAMTDAFRYEPTLASGEWSTVIQFAGNEDTSVWVKDSEGGLDLWHFLHRSEPFYPQPFCINLVRHDFNEGSTPLVYEEDED